MSVDTATHETVKESLQNLYNRINNLLLDHYAYQKYNKPFLKIKNKEYIANISIFVGNNWVGQITKYMGEVQEDLKVPTDHMGKKEFPVANILGYVFVFMKVNRLRLILTRME